MLKPVLNHSPCHNWLLSPAVIRDGSLEVPLVLEYLGDKPGIFVEIGANDPVKDSQTWALEQKGWTGLLVEPLAEKAEQLRQERKAQVEEVACGPPELDGSEAEFHISHKKDALSSLNPDGAKPGHDFAETRNVPVRTLDALVENAGYERIDFLSIDVEGFELEVLQGATLSRLRPRLCLIEDWAIDWKVHWLMKSSGYKRVRRTQVNSWYVPRQDKFPVSLLGYIQLFRKYYLNVPIHRMRHRSTVPD
tara:strand:- start:385 stop:1131 length:747 start_codon:yes stop_codon:yes gene_type:complete